MIPTLDLHFPNNHSLKTLAIVDISSYPSNFTVKNPTIEITAPSFPKKNLFFHTNSFNIYNSKVLDLSCGTCEYTELPDGIWTVKYSVSPAATNFVERTFLRVDKLKVRMEEVFLKVDIDQCDSNIKWQNLELINQIETYIEGAIAAANTCNNIMAMKFYTIASKMITNLLKKC